MAKKNDNLTAMARKAGLPPAAVHQRVKKLGWSVEKALNTPTRKTAKKVKASTKSTRPQVVVASPAAPAATTKKPSPVIPDARKRIEQLEAELLKAKKQCKLAQIAALIVIVAVVAWAVNP